MRSCKEISARFLLTQPCTKFWCNQNLNIAWYLAGTKLAIVAYSTVLRVVTQRSRWKERCVTTFRTAALETKLARTQSLPEGRKTYLLLGVYNAGLSMNLDKLPPETRLFCDS